MHDAKTIDHFWSHRHANFTVAFFYFQYLYAEPLAKQIVLHHVRYYISWGWRSVLFHYLLSLLAFSLVLIAFKNGLAFFYKSSNALIVVMRMSSFELQFIFYLQLF